jgi:hypothetical protein
MTEIPEPVLPYTFITPLGEGGLSSLYQWKNIDLEKSWSIDFGRKTKGPPLSFADAMLLARKTGQTCPTLLTSRVKRSPSILIPP